MKIHICLVSDQILANLIPALMDPPDLVVLVCTPAMIAKGRHNRLESEMRARSIETQVVGDAPDTGFVAITGFAKALAAVFQESFPNASLTLNATGGTKLMSLGFLEAFRSIGQAIYTDTAHRKIEYLPGPDGSCLKEAPMTDVLDVRNYLATQGVVFHEADSDHADRQKEIATRKAMSLHLGTNIHRLGGLVGTLNGMASSALEQDPQTRNHTLKLPQQRFNSVPQGHHWETALLALANAKIITWRQGSADLEFVDVSSALFLKGGWLEEYAYLALAELGAFDVKLGVHIQSVQRQAEKNEFDVIAVHGNQLLFIECKTLRFRENENDNDLAYKLNTLGTQARGLFGETWLLSARPPTPVLAERVADLGIRLIGPTELPRLREAAQAWMHGSP